MNLKSDIDWKSLIIGAVISAVIVILASYGYDWLFPFAAVGLVYVGYKAKNISYGTVLGMVAAIPLVYLAFNGALGIPTGFFASTLGTITLAILILLLGAFIGFIGAWAKRDRMKAIAEYKKKQKIGKKRKK